MKRCWFGAGLLVFLLIAGLTVSIAMGNFQKELALEVAQCAEMALSDRAAAKEMLDQAKAKWQKLRPLAAGLADHDPMNEADALFALLVPQAEDADFRENARHLAEVLRHLGQSHLPTLENIF